MTVRIVKVIFCDEAQRGRGTEDNVVRRLACLYTLDGKLICEFDPGPTGKDPKTIVSDGALQEMRDA